VGGRNSESENFHSGLVRNPYFALSRTRRGRPVPQKSRKEDTRSSRKSEPSSLLGGEKKRRSAYAHGKYRGRICSEKWKEATVFLDLRRPSDPAVTQPGVRKKNKRGGVKREKKARHLIQRRRIRNEVRKAKASESSFAIIGKKN